MIRNLQTRRRVLAAVSKEHDSVCGTHGSQVRFGSVLPIAGDLGMFTAASLVRPSLCAKMAAWMGAAPSFLENLDAVGIYME